jgi:hypothetical protein
MKIEVRNIILIDPTFDNVRFDEKEDYPIVLIDLESNGVIVKDVLLGQMDRSKYSDVNVFIVDVLENFKVK